jgi:hypothetical protein
MPRKELPDFIPPLAPEMRRMWRAYPDENVHRLLLEIERQRRIFREIEQYREVVARVWSQENQGTMVALEKLRLLMTAEKRFLEDK